MPNPSRSLAHSLLYSSSISPLLLIRLSASPAFLPHNRRGRDRPKMPEIASSENLVRGFPFTFFQLLVLLVLQELAPVGAHRSPSSYASSALTEWRSAHASYYAAFDPRDTVGGACGYGDLGRSGYGMATAGLSETLFAKGEACGGCYEVRCVEELRYCLPGTSMVLTVTNFCAPNYGLPSDAGGICNHPNHHFLMPIEAFEKIAIWKAGVMPIQYRRIKCIREGGVRFTMEGRGFFITVLISNVAGAGDVTAVKVKGTRIGWLSMARNWGQNWHVSADLKGQALSFELTTSDGVTLTSYNVAPKGWAFGQTYVGKQFAF